MGQFLAKELAAQYDDLVRAITANTYREVVTKAKNIVEAIVADRLGTVETSRDLHTNLQTIRTLMEANPEDGASGWSYLEYHLCKGCACSTGRRIRQVRAKSGARCDPNLRSRRSRI
jgi:hypothetical protein